MYDRQDTNLINGSDKMIPIWSRVLDTNTHLKFAVVPMLPHGSCLQQIVSDWQAETHYVRYDPEMTQVACALNCFGLCDLSSSELRHRWVVCHIVSLSLPIIDNLLQARYH